MDKSYEVFIDTNTLTNGEQGLNLNKLREIASLIEEFGADTSFRVPQQVVQEIVAQSKIALKGRQDKLRLQVQWWKENYNSEITLPPTEFNVKQYIEKHLIDAGIEIAPVKLEELDLPGVLNSIFEKNGMLGTSDKGAKDMVLAEAMSHLANKSSKTFAITYDGEFGKYLKRKFEIETIETPADCASQLRLRIEEEDEVSITDLMKQVKDYWQTIEENVVQNIRSDFKRQYSPSKIPDFLSASQEIQSPFLTLLGRRSNIAPSSYEWTVTSIASPNVSDPIFVNEKNKWLHWSVSIKLTSEYIGKSEDSPGGLPYFSNSYGIQAQHTTEYVVKFTFGRNNNVFDMTASDVPIFEHIGNDTVIYSSVLYYSADELRQINPNLQVPSVNQIMRLPTIETTLPTKSKANKPS